MLFLTFQNIEDRIAQGIPEDLLYKEPSRLRLKRAAEIITLIEEAFSEVRLGVGVGLFEGQAIDDYSSDSQRKQMRAKDEKEDWRRIKAKHLNACPSSLSFFDTLGMRFHLPAFICSELRGEYEQGLHISLSDLDDWKKQKFGLLSPQQKSAVAIFLEFLAEDVNTEFSRDAIMRDIEKFWCDH